ncbi:NADH cytochrome b5 reductase, partial [Trifolium pratense]
MLKTHLSIAIFICTSYKFNHSFILSVFIACLNPEQFSEFKLVKKAQLSHNVAKFTFELPTPTSVLGLLIGQHINCRGKDGQGDEVIKPYTPTTLDSDVGHFELVIK